MFTKRSFILSLVLVVGLLFAAAPTKPALAAGELTLNVGAGQAYATLEAAMAAVPADLDKVTYVLYDDQTFTTTGHGTPDLAMGADVVNLKKAPTVTGEVKLTLAGVYYGTLNAIGAEFNVEGLTLINGRDKSGEGTDPWEFAYFEPDSASVTFTDCKFNNGVMVSIDATFDNCLFSRQPLTFPPDTTDYSLNDYALWIHNFGDVVVKNSTFENFEYGGVKSTWNMYATGADLSLTLQDNTFVNIGNGGDHTIANLDGAVSVTITGNLVIDSYLGSTTDEQTALLEIDPITPTPTITVNSNIWATPSVVYVDDGWASVPIGDDPDDAGPAIAMGYDAFATVEGGVAAVGAGGLVNVYDGVYNPPATITLDKAISIIGPTTGEVKIIGAAGATNKIFNISTSDVTIQYLTFTLAVPPTAGDAMIYATDGTAVGEEPKTNINILDNEIYVEPQAGAMITWQAQAIYLGRLTTESKVNRNTIYNTRSGLVVAYQSALEIKDNVIYNTKGGIMNYTGTVADADARVMINNSWGTVHNEWDIVWNSGGGPYVMDMDKYVLQLSKAQSDARVVSLMTTGVLVELTGNRSHVFVNATTGTTTIKADNGNINVPYAKIQDGINAVVPGGTVYVAAGTYAETLGGWRDLEINKSLSLIGAGSELTIVELTGLQNGLGITADATGIVHLEGIKFTKHGTNINSAGWPIRIGGPGQTFNGITLKDIDVGYAGARNLHFEGTGTYNNIWIEDCYIHDSDIYGASISGPATGVKILNSKFNHNGWNDPGDYNTSSGNYTYHGYGLAFEKSTTDVEVTDSEFNDNGTNGINMSGVTNAVFDGITANGNGFWTPGLYDGDLGVNFWEFTTGSSNIVFENSTFKGNQRGGFAIGGQWDALAGIHDVEVTSSEIMNNQHHSLLLWFDCPYSGINIHHNRIIDTGAAETLIGLFTSPQPLPDNWWGCNEGFGQPGCSAGMWCLTGNCFNTPTWLEMNVTDLPATMLPGGTQAFAANLTKNNLGDDTSAEGYLPSTTSVAFTPSANVDPDSDTLTLGVAETTFTAPGDAGAINVCAILDNETVCDTTEVPAPAVTFADDSWTGVLPGTDPDGIGPATIFGYDAFVTIQEAIDAVAANGTVNVFPGAYNETASGRTLDNGGTYQFGLFFDSAKPGITMQGVKADGTVITAAADVAASIKTNATNSFGYSGVFVEADNITITGFEFLDNYVGGAVNNNKTLEVIGDNFTFKDNVMSVAGGGSLYLNDWSYDSETGISRFDSYNIAENLFKFGASVDISSGVGVSGDASGRVIADNTFTADGEDVYWANISFNGTIPSVGWFVDPVGGATITGNTFIGGEMPIRSRGIVEDDFDWASYITGNNFEKAVIAWDPVADEPRAYTYTSGTYTLNNVIVIGTIIQDEIGHAQSGDEVRVIKGTFVEDVTVNKDITLVGIPDPFALSPTVVVDGLITVTADGATVTNLKVSPGPVTGQVAAISVYAGNTTVSGNLIDGMAGNGTASVKGIFVYGGSSTALTNIIIDGNTVKNISNTGWGTDGIQIQGVLDGVAVTDNTVQTISSVGWAFGIEVTPTGSFPTTPPQNVTITGNIVDGVTATTYPGVALGIDAAGPGMLNPADASQVTVHQNVFINYQAAASSKDTLHQLDATLNYWGSPCGPVAGTIYGDILVYPWNVDAAGTPMSLTPQTHNFLPTTGMTVINETIACAPSYSTFNFGTGEYAGNVIVPSSGQDHQTLVLADDANINATSPCFTVGADFTTIKAENIGMASCFTAAGSNGIDVAAGLRNLTVDGLEIYGPGNDGIHFAGVIRDVVLKDNYIHNLAGNGVYFGAQPVELTPGGIDIHGNLFQANTLLGVTNPNGTAPIDATFNSWGDVAGPGGTLGDGVGPNVTATPFTHVDVYMVASATPWTPTLNQVASGQTITFKVMAHVVNAEGVDIKLSYPSANFSISSSAVGGVFSSLENLDISSTGTIWYYGGRGILAPVTGTVELFTVTFTGGTTGLDLPMDLDELSDVFGMEGVGSSSNIYAVALVDSTVNVINLPEIDIVPVTGQTYVAGLPIEFNITVTNTGGGNFADLNLDFTLPAGAVLQYCSAGDPCTTWANVTDPMDIGTLAEGGSAFVGPLPLFRVIFSTPPTGTISVALMDLAPATDFQLATASETFTLAGNFIVTGTFSMQGRSTRAGIPVTLTYQPGLMAYGPLTEDTINQISYNLTIADVNGGQWLLTTLQPRYLNVIIANNKIVTVDGNETLIALQLKGGNAKWEGVNDANVINVNDASQVGNDYGNPLGVPDPSTLDGDCNFDGKVNVLDLALVGGNFDLTSQTAYGVGNLDTWTVQ